MHNILSPGKIPLQTRVTLKDQTKAVFQAL